VSIRRSIQQVDGTLREKDAKSRRSRSRRLALDEATVALLRQHRLRQREEALALGIRLADDALLFATPEGRPWRPDVCTNRFGRLRAKLDLGHVRLHDLRHFVASVLIDGGIAISTVSTRLGHSQMSTTLNSYTHAIPATDQKAADYLGDIPSLRLGRRIVVPIGQIAAQLGIGSDVVVSALAIARDQEAGTEFTMPLTNPQQAHSPSNAPPTLF
jgi:integrase